jgi:hypothetical protein
VPLDDWMMKRFIYSLQYMIEDLNVWSLGEVLDVVLLESSEMSLATALTVNRTRQQMDVVLWDTWRRDSRVTYLTFNGIKLVSVPFCEGRKTA